MGAGVEKVALTGDQATVYSGDTTLLMVAGMRAMG